MNTKYLYTILIAALSFGSMNAQLDCRDFFDVNLDSNGEAQVLASDLVDDVEFFIANGTLTYFILPYNSGVFESGSDFIAINCNNAGVHQYIIEYTVDGELIDNCWGTLNVFDPEDVCVQPTFCDEVGFDCADASPSYSITNLPPNPIPAEFFALCSESEECTGTYQIAIGSISEATMLDYDATLDPNDIVDYVTPLVLSYTENGGTQFDQALFYVWENLDCFIVPKNSLTVDINSTGEVTLAPEMFLHPDNTCTDVVMAITEVNGPVPTDYFNDIVLNCEDLGYHTIYLKNLEYGMTTKSQLFLADPEEVCGPILEPGDKLIKMSNDPPLGTYAGTKLYVNGNQLEASVTGKGWIINEDMLQGGTNTLEFDSGPFILNGVSTLDMVKLLRLIIMDEYDEPMQSIVMDMDNSGYNGIGDLILLRQLILGQQVNQEPTNVLFKPVELEFPADFTPFDFDYDVTTYSFEDSDFDDSSFSFEAFKVGDMNKTAITEDGIRGQTISSTRDLASFKVTEMEVEADVPFNFSLIYDTGTPIKGLLAALVSNGVTFQTLTSHEGSDVQYNIIDDTEIRISYVSPDPMLTIDRISFEITAISENSGTLIDLLGLKSGFPQEVIDENDEVITIEELEELVTTSIDFEENLIELNIYPNPASDRLILSTTGLESGSVEILDSSGRRIQKQTILPGETVIDIVDMERGFYFLKLKSNGQVFNKMFVKQ